MNTNQEDSIRRARMEALVDKQRSELPDVQAAALQAAIDAEDEDTAAEIARAIRNRLLKDSDAEVALDRLGLQVPSGATFTAWWPRGPPASRARCAPCLWTGGSCPP